MMLNPFILTVPYSGRMTGFVSLLELSRYTFGILLTRTSEGGLPLFKEEVVEYFPPVIFWSRPPFAIALI